MIFNACIAGMEKSNMCDIEVNLCYSDPCGNNGQCLQREGGYTCNCLSQFTGKTLYSFQVEPEKNLVNMGSKYT